LVERVQADYPHRSDVAQAQAETIASWTHRDAQTIPTTLRGSANLLA
jgi:hypothetical protein